MPFEKEIQAPKIESNHCTLGEITERDAGADELGLLISQIHAENSQRSPLTPSEAVEKLFRNPNSLIICLQDGSGKMAGFAYGYEMQEADFQKGDRNKLRDLLSDASDRIIYLVDIGIKRDCRRQGYSRIMLEHFIECARKRGAKMIALSAHEDNADFPASRYTVMGFHDSGIKRAGGDGVIDPDYKYMVMDVS